MPQLDLVSYLGLVCLRLGGFSLIYFINVGQGLPFMVRILKVRENKLRSHRSEGTSEGERAITSRVLSYAQGTGRGQRDSVLLKKSSSRRGTSEFVNRISSLGL